MSPYSSETVFKPLSFMMLMFLKYQGQLFYILNVGVSEFFSLDSNCAFPDKIICDVEVFESITSRGT